MTRTFPALSPHRMALTLLAALMATLLMVGVARSQEATPAAVQQAAPQKAVTQDDINTVARELWCPLCSGVRLDVCELKACDQMKDVIEIKLGEGETLQSIRDYFVQQYGPQVLGEPPLQGFNWLAWILPVAVVVGGGVYLWSRARRMVHPAAAPTEASEPLATDPVDAALVARLDEELKQNE